MASQKQTEANRRNASLSTGPKTQEGKAVVAKNAVTHGFYCRHLVLHGESDDDLLALRKSIYASLRPTDGLEAVYVERYVVAAWKLHRLIAAEPHHVRSRDDMFRGYNAGPKPETHAYDYAYSWLETSANAFKFVAALERSMDKTIAELMKLRKNRIDTSDADSYVSRETATAAAPIETPIEAPTEAPSNAIIENKANFPPEPAPEAPQTPERSATMPVNVITPTPISKFAETNPIPPDPAIDVDTNSQETNPIPDQGGTSEPNI